MGLEKHTALINKKNPVYTSVKITSYFEDNNQSCVGAIANRGQWEQGCSLSMDTDLGPVRATRRKKNKKICNV